MLILLNINRNELSEFWNMIKKIKETNLYTLYSVYIEYCVKNLGFYDLLNQTIYEPIEFITAKNIILKVINFFSQFLAFGFFRL